MQYLYIIKCQGFHKIGIANDVKSRLAQLSTGNPFILEVVNVYGFENAEVVEKAVHQRYKNLRQRGEWFMMNEHALSEVRQICSLLGGQPENYSEEVTNAEIEVEEDVQDYILDDPEVRIEKRYLNGVLRGFAIIERNKDRKVLRYVGSKSDPEEFENMLKEMK